MLTEFVTNLIESLSRSIEEDSDALLFSRSMFFSIQKIISLAIKCILVIPCVALWVIALLCDLVIMLLTTPSNPPANSSTFIFVARPANNQQRTTNNDLRSNNRVDAPITPKDPEIVEQHQRNGELLTRQREYSQFSLQSRVDAPTAPEPDLVQKHAENPALLAKMRKGSPIQLFEYSSNNPVDAPEAPEDPEILEQRKKNNELRKKLRNSNYL